MENKKLTDLDFSVRALNSFKQNNFVNLSDVLNIDERGLKDLNFSSRTIKEVMQYKTIHENEVFINPPKEVKHYNMGEILFEIEKLKTTQQLNEHIKLCSPQCFCDGSCKKPLKSLAQKLDENELQRFTEVYDRGIGVLPHERGEYVKLEDILAFESKISAKKNKTEENKNC